MRLYFASDLHGSDKCWRKFLNAASFYDAEVIIVGGDITGKSIIPILQAPDGTAQVTYRGVRRTATTADQLATIRRQISFGGDYSLILDQDELERLSNSEVERDKAFKRLVLERVAEWVELADEKLHDSAIRCFVSCGNDDFFEVDEVLASGRAIEVPEGRAVELGDGLQMIGVGYANITPWRCPRDISEEELAARIDAAVALLDDPAHAVFDIHVPPYDSQLDKAPRLTEDLVVVRASGGETEMVPVGSTAVRDALITYHPLLGLHGHVHESQGIGRIGETTIVNPGSEYQEGILHGAVIDIDKRRGIRQAQLVSG